MTTKCRLGLSMAMLACTLTPTEFSAQAGRGGQGVRGWGSSSQYNRLYDPDSVEIVAGEVVALQQFTPASGVSPGVHLLIEAEGDTVSVHLGPVWYIADQDIQIGVGDVVRLLGSTAVFDGEKIIIAAEVIKEGQTLVLRYPNGAPFWSRGGGRRRRPVANSCQQVTW